MSKPPATPALDEPPADLSYTVFLDRKLVEREMSRTAFAERIGRARAWVTMMLKGQRPLQPDLIEPVADALELTEPELLELRALVERSHANSRPVRERAERYLSGLGQRRTAESLGDDVMPHLSRWYIGAVLELARCDGYRPDPEWLAATVHPPISPDDAAVALQVLQKVGLLDEDAQLAPESPQNVGTRTHIEPTQPHLDDVRALQATHLEHARQSIDEFAPTERHMTSAVVALDDDGFERLRHVLHEQFTVTVCEASERCESPNRLYRVGFTLFPASLYTDVEYDPWDLD